MRIITSRTNLQIKAVSALHHAKFRTKQQQFIAEGIRTCTTLIESNIELIINLFVTESMLTQAKKLVSEEKIILVSPHVMEKISTAATPSGLLGIFPIPPQPFFDQLTSGIVLVRIANPGNMGTLIRSAAAMNKKTVVIIEGADPWSPKVVQASAGTIGLVQLFKISWQELLQNKTLSLCALVISGGKRPKEINLKKYLLIIGSEAHGIPEEWIKN